MHGLGLEIQVMHIVFSRPHSVCDPYLAFLFLVETIKIDIPRTFPDNIYFDNYETQLFNILCSYAHYNKEVGYCQVMSDVPRRHRQLTDLMDLLFRYI
jgi:Rab-GTPase-TBC domain